MDRSLKVELRKSLPVHTQTVVMYRATEVSARLTCLDPKRFNEKYHIYPPEYGDGWTYRFAIADEIDNKGFSIFSVGTQSPDGNVEKWLFLDAYLEFISVTNYKGRTRKMFECYHADRLNYAVAGTPNRLEYGRFFL